MKITAVASPNFNPRPAGVAVDAIVLHADASDDAQASVSWIKSRESMVSYHVLVDRDGTVYRFVETSQRAWHAGVSSFRGRAGCNDYSIGLSFANRCDGVESFTTAQYEAGAVLCAAWMRVHPAITLDRITTHALIALPLGRKHDPGPLFDLPHFLERVSAELAKPPIAAA